VRAQGRLGRGRTVSWSGRPFLRDVGWSWLGGLIGFEAMFRFEF